jgi:PAS domain S-box-containing protein
MARASTRAAAWVGALLIAGVAALVAIDIVRTYRATVDSTSRELETQARIIAEQTARTVQAVDIVLRHIASEHHAGRLGRFSPDALNAYLHDQAVGLTQIDAFALVDRNGDVTATSNAPPTTSANVATLPAFIALRDGSSVDFQIGEAVRSQTDGRWMIPVGRRLQGADGQFAGAIGARLRIGYFEDFYRNVQLESGSMITLMHADGSLLARQPPAEGAFGRRFPGLAPLLAGAADAQGNAPRVVSAIDGVERFTAIHTVPDYPLAVLVSRETSVALAPWKAQAFATVARTLALGSLAGVVMVLLARKITRLQDTQDSLAEMKDRFALAVAGSDDGIWDWDQSTDQIFSSARARELYGLPPGPEIQDRLQWIGQVALHPDDAPRLQAAFQAHLDGRTSSFECEYRVRHSDGRYRWIRARGLCVRNPAGQPLRMAGSVSDIDARRRAEEAQAQSEQRYQLAIAGVNQGVWDWDLDTDEVFMSARAQELFGREPGAPLRPRRAWIEQWTYHPDDRLHVRQTLSDYLHGAAESFEVEYRMLHPDGHGRWYRDRGVAVRDTTGRARRMAGSIEDVTDRKHAQAERDRLENQLRQTQRLEAIGTLAGGVAHDFNNILGAILGYGEMAQKESGEGTALRRYIDACISAGLRAKALVERILAFSRAGMGELMPVHVQTVVSEALEVVAGSLPPGVRFERQLAAGDAGLLGDPTQLQQVVLNLCSNAVQAMKGEGALAVSVDTLEQTTPLIVTTNTLQPGHYVRLRVSDTGPGIDPGVIDRIFDPFFTTKEVGVGTGLGLSLVHGIVTDLGGGIDIDNQPGAGAAFSVYVPWQCSVTVAPKQEEKVALGNGETILLVDDETALVQLGEEMLAELGYDAVGLASPTEALELVRADPERFDAVLSDEAMPGLTGSELAVEIRKVRADIPIVLMSGYVTPALAARARELGISDVLDKPLVSREIARGLASALRHAQRAAKLDSDVDATYTTPARSTTPAANDIVNA